MNYLFIRFNGEGNPVSASTRGKGRAVKLELWEGYEFYKVLISTGHRPIEMQYPEGGHVHMVMY